ncbi:conserved hypothetical protein [Candidatus Nitrotoga sp. BS]|uniref:hypothetical protein n=1 Tax=Candidatus Nitrotoga sp. BS TaxID=2890408 RepID=UPI001EF1D42F|nr:hypothetical protein [Candidatus Nitrotoga sp. BS]CAH1196026.1 conserved hypothetical protein [Candidatus Nitrotoga sp. BS]
MTKLFKKPQLRKPNETKVKCELISKHLSSTISGCKVKHKQNFKTNVVVFYMEISGVAKEIKISNQYLQDYTPIEIFGFIRQKEVIKIISAYEKVHILIREGYPAINYR